MASSDRSEVLDYNYGDFKNFLDFDTPTHSDNLYREPLFKVKYTGPIEQVLDFSYTSGGDLPSMKDELMRTKYQLSRALNLLRVLSEKQRT